MTTRCDELLLLSDEKCLLTIANMTGKTMLTSLDPTFAREMIAGIDVRCICFGGKDCLYPNPELEKVAESIRQQVVTLIKT